MTEFVYRDLARQLMVPLYSGERIRYEDRKLAAGRTEKLVLMALADGEGLYPSVLCRMINASSPRMAVILKTLEKKGLLKRTADPNDCRKTIIKATEEGILFGKECIADVEEQMSETLQLLGEEDAREYVRLQQKVSEALKKPKKGGRFSK